LRSLWLVPFVKSEDSTLCGLRELRANPKSVGSHGEIMGTVPKKNVASGADGHLENPVTPLTEQFVRFDDVIQFEIMGE
jgi:hypothetical protein